MSQEYTYRNIWVDASSVEADSEGLTMTIMAETECGKLFKVSECFNICETFVIDSIDGGEAEETTYFDEMVKTLEAETEISYSNGDGWFELAGEISDYVVLTDYHEEMLEDFKEIESTAFVKKYEAIAESQVKEFDQEAKEDLAEDEVSDFTMVELSDGFVFEADSEEDLREQMESYLEAEEARIHEIKRELNKGRSIPELTDWYLDGADLWFETEVTLANGEKLTYSMTRCIEGIAAEFADSCTDDELRELVRESEEA